MDEFWAEIMPLAERAPSHPPINALDFSIIDFVDGYKSTYWLDCRLRMYEELREWFTSYFSPKWREAVIRHHLHWGYPHERAAFTHLVMHDVEHLPYALMSIPDCGPEPFYSPPTAADFLCHVSTHSAYSVERRILWTGETLALPTPATRIEPYDGVLERTDSVTFTRAGDFTVTSENGSMIVTVRDAAEK